MLPRAALESAAHGLEDIAIGAIKPDGQASIEHQIDIHVLDLAECHDSIIEVLHGLKYCMEFRIKGGKLPHLDQDLMDRLLSALLPLCAKSTGNLLTNRPTAEADLAFELFAQFMKEVMEFRIAVSKRSATDLREGLKLHRRCQSWSTPTQREMAAEMLSLIIHTFPKSLNWKDLVKADECDDVAELMLEFKAKFEEKRTQELSILSGPERKLFPPPALYFDRTPERLAEMFDVNFDQGLSSSQVRDAAAHYGPNSLPAPKKTSPLKMLMHQFTDFMIIILLIATVVEIVINEINSAIVLATVIIINVVIGFNQELKASRALEALDTLSVPQASVLREGALQTVDASQLVPGDIVNVEEGDAIPADLRLFDVSQLEVVESILTGESVPTSKSIVTIRKRTRKLPLGDCKGTAFMATVVAKGRARGIVVRTGIHTEIGKISQAITSAPVEPTNIQKKLARLGKILVVLSLGLCALVVAISLAHLNHAMQAIEVGISLAVSVIPEGLVAVVTVTMAIGVRRMAARNAIVRQLASVETLGSVSVICSDKTGTLTEGKMGCVQIWTADNGEYTFSDSTSPDPTKGRVEAPSVHVPLQDAMDSKQQAVPAPVPTPWSPSSNQGLATNLAAPVPNSLVPVSTEFQTAPAHLVASAMVASLCNNAQVKLLDGKWTTIGDPTEVAMVVAAQKAGFDSSFFLNNLGLSRLAEFAFDSDRKLMSVIYHQTNLPSDPSYCLEPDTALVLVKGAPEGVLSKCVSYLPASSSTRDPFVSVLSQPAVPLTPKFVDFVSQRSAQMASQGLRVLALALKTVSIISARELAADTKNAAAAESNLVFVGLIGLIDPARPGVKESVASCHKAGVRVIMITGDHIATATAIAKQLGILKPDNVLLSRSMAGYEVDSLSLDALADLNPFPVVFARVSPDNKLKIVEALQSRGASVAMTGDGVNDAPAIKRANVGIAMGIGGTEITKQAADIVLADDNFSSIVEAVREGRRVFDNIRKFCVYLLSCNSAEIFLFLMAAIKNTEMPFSTIQILWANIIADVPPAMSLGVEPFEFDIMERKPRAQDEGVVTVSAAVTILFQGLLMSVASFVVFVLSVENIIPGYDTLPKQRSLAFLILTTMQILQVFFSRSVQNSVFRVGVFGNRAMIAASLLSFAGLVGGVYIPGMSHWLEFEAVNWLAWVIVLIACLLQLALVELFKLGLRWHIRRKLNEPVATKKPRTASRYI